MFYVGLDLGQKKDHTAVAIVERIDHRRAFQGTAFEKLLVRYVERMPLGMPYPRIVERVREIVQHDELRGNCSLAVDATGVGGPVVDMLRTARLGCNVTAYTITGGGSAGSETAPKVDLMAGLLVLLEQGQLKIGKLRDGPQLMRELTDVRLASHGIGRVRLGADGYGEHDDLVIALALACWRVKRGTCGEVGHRLPGI